MKPVNLISCSTTITSYDCWSCNGASGTVVPAVASTMIELTGKQLPISTLCLLHTVDELKQVVAATTGAKVEQVQLVLKNKPLDDESKTLGDYGVEAATKVVKTSRKSADVEESVPPAHP
jgi:hypothetical protein